MPPSLRRFESGAPIDAIEQALKDDGAVVVEQFLPPDVPR
jgi:hypothetical protein